NPSVDIALFGRMAASDPTLNYDAAAQVAHAISTHAVQNEYDYFTAVDDLQTEDNAGAGHLGTIEFNSSTMYRYATVNVSELVKTLGAENTASAVKKFGQAFIFSMPTGKENTFANRTLPDMVYVTLRSDQPVNLCGAFEMPIKKSDSGYVSASKSRLMEYAQNVYSQFAAEPDKAWVNDISSELSLPELLSQLEKSVNDRINEV
ncbi:MAG: type I-E CRISPR-associated protein Cas7/Cse4/CasC, partial [Clostridia bacterium]|nr:type I-E CRISPR-associated protein Cas7/Cse4/CasC [Clostridia bacterium]